MLNMVSVRSRIVLNFFVDIKTVITTQTNTAASIESETPV